MKPTDPATAPRHWPVWISAGIGRCVARLPYGVQLALGRMLGRIALRVARRRREIAATNLRLCFPELDDRRRATLLQRNFESMGIGLIESALAWWGNGNRLRRMAAIEGLEHLDAALAQGKGVILLSAHFTTLELAGRLLALHRPFHVQYRDHRNPAVERLMRRARERNFERAIPRGEVRAFLNSLRDGHAVWYAPDQDYGREHSVFAPFFGIPAATVTATARIARLSGAAVVPFFPERLPDRQGYRLRLLPALAQFPGDDAVADCARINALIEGVVRRVPEQYLWAHRRFKTRPAGERDVYA